MRNLPASRIVGSVLEESLIADGCIIGAGTRLERSLIGVRSVIGGDCVIRDVVMIGSDKFETPAQKAENERKGQPSLNIGDGSVIERAILDKDCRIGKRVRLVNREGRQDFDAPNGLYHIRDGIICIPRGTVIPDGAVV